MSLIYEIADEYLPDKNVYGIDSPDVLLAEEIVCKVLDVVYEEIAPIQAMTKEGMEIKDKVIDILQALKEGKE